MELEHGRLDVGMVLNRQMSPNLNSIAPLEFYLSKLSGKLVDVLFNKIPSSLEFPEKIYERQINFFGRLVSSFVCKK